MSLAIDTKISEYITRAYAINPLKDKDNRVKSFSMDTYIEIAKMIQLEEIIYTAPSIVHLSVDGNGNSLV